MNEHVKPFHHPSLDWMDEKVADELFDCYVDLVEAGFLPELESVSITTRKGYEHDVRDGSGSLVYDWNKATMKDGVFHVPKRDVPMKEEEFVSMAAVFSGTVFERVFQSLKSTNMIGRIRLMCLKPHNCLSWHVDDTDRIHFPFHTREGCLMGIEDRLYHLGRGRWWYTSTRIPHTAFNGSRLPRFHIVACVLQNPENGTTPN